jgi:hypothetical protein
MQYIAEYAQVFMLLDTGMTWHEAFEEFARHQVDLGGCNCIPCYGLNQDVI